MKRTIPDGYTAKVRHERVIDQDGKPSTHGGITRVAILNRKGNIVAIEHAICRPNEPYNKKLGREIALGRALKYMEKRMLID